MLHRLDRAILGVVGQWLTLQDAGRLMCVSKVLNETLKNSIYFWRAQHENLNGYIAALLEWKDELPAEIWELKDECFELRFFEHPIGKLENAQLRLKQKKQELETCKAYMKKVNEKLLLQGKKRKLSARSHSPRASPGRY